MTINYFDVNTIRKNKKHLGKRKQYPMTISEDTINRVASVVERGKGKYGSAVVELGTRLLLALVSENQDDVEIVFTELVDGVKSPYFARNLTKLYRMYIG